MRHRDVRRLPIGAEVQPDGSTAFRVWAPDPREVGLVIERCTGGAEEVVLTPEADGYYSARVSAVGHGDRYRYRLDGDLFADPASRFQPDGPFGPSEIVDPARFRWHDAGWRGRGLDGQIIYEMHLGTFTPEGTWRAAIDKLPLLAETGITLLEVMPVSEFPGRFGWGYDGVFPYAPTRLYGAPDDFRAFVDRAHALHLAVILDVVYNHLGPDGCVFSRFASRYFTRRYTNEWGDALNFDAQDAAPAREYWCANAAYWVDEFHLDGLRLDATQSIHDHSDEHILTAIARRARSAAGDRRVVLISENEPQCVDMVRPVDHGGHGLDALWNDDFHHSALVALTGHNEAYYSDHQGVPQELISAAKYGYLFQGQRYAWQAKPRGSRTDGLPPATFVNFIENHDQLANSGDGSRVRYRTAPGRYRAMTALFLLMPGTPMLFQGQEFGASTPFLYFADHNPELAPAVEQGRAEFVAQFPSLGDREMQDRLARPHDPATFARSKLDWSDRDTNESFRSLHADLIALRRGDVAFNRPRQGEVDGAVLAPEAFVLRYPCEDALGERLLLINLGSDLVRPSFAEPLLAPPGGCTWTTYWSSESPGYGGLGTPPVLTERGWRIPGHSAIVLRPEKTHGGDGADRR